VDEKSVISGADWLPTLCALTGTKIDAAAFDGEDASKAWRGGDFTRTKPLLWKTSAVQSASAIRDGQWKLHYPNSKRGELALYDLAADPGEKNNLAAQQPAIVQRLSAKVEAWQATLPKEYEKADDKD
jgi:N-acetylgalactosamine-6-sulfatase